VGGATDRNRVKRLVREAFAADAGRDARRPGRRRRGPASARELAEREGLDGVRGSLRELFEKAGGA